MKITTEHKLRLAWAPVTRFLILLALPSWVLADFSSSPKIAAGPTHRKDAELLWNSYIPNYMEKFFSTRNASSNFVDRRFGVSEDCVEDVLLWIEQLVNFRKNPLETETWALHMIDSWGKPPEGILSGHVNAMGDFDECVGLRGHDSKKSALNKPQFSGLYCTTYIASKTTSTSENPLLKKQHVFQHAVSIAELEQIIALNSDIMIHPSTANCFPSTCSQKDVQAIVSKYFEWANFTSEYNVVPEVGNCVTDQKPDFSSGVIVMIVILAALITLCLVATLVEISQQDKKPTGRWNNNRQNQGGIGYQYLLAFSVVKNTKALLNSSSSGSGDTLTCFYGLRFLSMAWIILMHTWGMLVASQVSWNLVDVKLIYKENWTSFLVHNGLVSVDTFFTMSGLLVTLNLLKALEKSEGRLNLALFYLHRYLRLTPAYALIIGCLATLIPYLSSGPNWYVMDMWSVNCQRNWWHNLLYFNNLVDYGTDFAANGMCAGLSWYLSADMQFFLLTPFLVYPLWRWKRMGKVILGFVTLGSILTPGLIAYVDHLVPTLITSRGNSLPTTKSLYFKPWARAGPYIVGMWTGYLLFKTAGGTTFKLPKRIIAACWLISTATALAVLLGIKSYFDPNYDIPVVGGALYAGLHRFVWGLVVAWVIVACVKGYAGWVNGFLSWRFFGPLSRLTFCMYLVSYFIQMTLHLRLRQPFYYDSYTMVNLFFAHLIMSILVSYALTVLLEMPFLHLDKLLFGRAAPRKVLHPLASTRQVNV